MPIYQGTYSVRSFTIKDAATKQPIDISGWQLLVHVKDSPSDVAPLMVLSTADDTAVVTDGAAGELELRFDLTEENAELLPTGRMHFDVLRTEVDPGPIWVFGGRFPVKRPVTLTEG